MGWEEIRNEKWLARKESRQVMADYRGSEWPKEYKILSSTVH